MTDRNFRPRCGNDPRAQLTDGDRQAVADFRAYLADRAALRDRIAEALHQDQTPPPTVSWADEQPLDREIFLRRADVVLAVLPAPTDRATVLREAIDVAREEGHRLEEVAGIEAARGARSVACLLRKLLGKVPVQRSADQAYGPRTFHLQRDHDVSGVSGTGRVADGVLWPDGTVSIRWRGNRPSTVHWDRLGDAEAIHGHQGATRIVWDAEVQP
ncbi:hypothetical protein [Streptomyces longwoodensis]|uniref:hypothetical protein n=1 Tax=Streptomyces longwoodensis TaxID=68231 RepID=UPI000AB1029C|nr:hypothetical protein [Streptomyces longwoodensis]